MKRLYKKILAILLIILVFILAIPKSFSFSLTSDEIWLFSIIGFISAFEIANDVSKRSYSLNLMHWIFILFFYFITPIIQLSNNYFPWEIYQTPKEITTTCWYIIIWIFFYEFGRLLLSKIRLKMKNSSQTQFKEKMTSNSTKSLSPFSLIILSLLGLLSSIILIRNIGLFNLFARKTASASIAISGGKLEQLVLSHCTRAILMFNVSVMLINFFKNKKGLFSLIINFFMLLVCCFPTGIPRNMAANIYLGLLIIFLYKNMEKNMNTFKYVLLFIFGFMIVFPTINAFRRNNFFEINLIQTYHNVINNISENYLSADYDAFSIIGDAKYYIDTHGITSGKQLLGSLFFYVPRSIWNSKAVGSGQLIFTSLGKLYTNVSCPIIAEALINFGIIGIMIFGLLFGLLSKKIDDYYWSSIEEKGVCLKNIIILYPFLLPSYFFMLRGDLQSTLAYMSAIIVIFVALSIVLAITNKSDIRMEVEKNI